MKIPKVLTIALVITLMMSALTTMSTGAASTTTTQTLTYRGMTSFTSTPASTPTGPSKPSQHSQYINRSPRSTYSAVGPLPPPVVASTPIDSSRPGLNNSFQGLNEYDSGVANGFPLEPPDQGLCAGNNRIVETINDVLQVYTTSGGAVTTATALNTFFQEDPTTIQLSDPSCYFDHDTQRWFQIVLGYKVDPTTGSLTGKNHLNIAVSTTAAPTSAYNLYSFPVQDDGTGGTPVHPNCPCIGDYPHLGADANGFYITTNEFPIFTSGFNGAQVYALSKRALARGAARVQVTQYGSLTASDGNASYTVLPATSPVGSYATGNGGTEFWLSSLAANNSTGTANHLDVWALTNTQALDGPGSPTLIRTSTNSNSYVVPPPSNQKIGSVPLGECLNHPFCANKYFGGQQPYHEREGQLDSSNSQMFQVSYASGLLWGALATGVNVNGTFKAGVAYFVVHPVVNASGSRISSAPVVKQGYVATANNNVIFPAIGVLATGQAVMAINVVGADYYPSAAYVTLDVASSGTSPIHIAAAGKGPEDGLCEYQFFGCSGITGVARPRWGDYAAAAIDGGTVYLGSEYIAQTCSYAQYVADPTCGGTRDQYANWSTRISSVTP